MLPRLHNLWSWRLDMVAASPPTTNDAYKALRMAGFRAAKAGRAVPVLSRRDDPYEQIRTHWEEIGKLFRRSHDRTRVIEAGVLYEVTWRLQCWTSRADAGSGWALAKVIGDGFWGGSGHGDHCVRAEGVVVTPTSGSLRSITMELWKCE